MLPLLVFRCRRRAASLTLALAAVGGLGACDVIERDETSGQLSQAVFRYQCVDDDDAMCDEGDVARTFPRHIARAGRFEVQVTDASVRDPETLAAIVESAWGRIVSSVDGRRFSANEPGVVALLARTDRSTADFIHLQVEAIAALDVTGPDQAIFVGGRPRFRVTPRSAFGDELAGSLEYRWASSAPSILPVTGGAQEAEVQTSALAPGVATLTVEHGELSRSFEVVVLEGGV